MQRLTISNVITIALVLALFSWVSYAAIFAFLESDSAYRFLANFGLLNLSLTLLLVIIGFVGVFRGIFNGASKKAIAGGNIDDLSKKHYAVDINKYSFLILMLGLSLSFGFMYILFEYPNFEEQVLVDLGTREAEVEEQIEIPPTEQKPPPPPKVQMPEIVEVKNEEKIEEETQEVFQEFTEEVKVEEVKEEVVEVEEEKEDFDKIFKIVEQNAEPVGGMAAFYKYVGKNIKYPKQAKRMGIEGRVFLNFVVEKDGSITDIKVMRKLGGGCDEEAIRVLKKAPKWNPAKQRGRAVRVNMTIPVLFKLK